MIKERYLVYCGVLFFLASIISLIWSYQLINWAIWQTPWDTSFLISIQIGMIISNILLLFAGLTLIASLSGLNLRFIGLTIATVPCPDCGKNNPPNNRYCGNCGYPFKKHETED